MALFRDDQGKTEKATPGRLQEARGKGQVAISKELTMAGTLLVAVLALEYLGGWLIQAFEEVCRFGFQVDLSQHALDGDDVLSAVQEIENVMLLVLGPFAFFLLLFVAATMLFGYGQIGGIKMSPKALEWKLDRLNPVTNLSRLFKFTSLFKAIFSFAKLIVLGGVLWAVLASEWRNIAGMHDHHNLAMSLGIVAKLVFRVFFWISLIVMILAVADVAWQRYDFAERMKMSKQEVEDERKRDDGDPVMKSRLKGARMKLMRQRMMDAVPQADVIITNPTHFSVALRYDREQDHAPRVVAKGVDDMAFKIRELARDNDVPLMEDPPLARALFRAVDVGNTIPELFYQAVATVLGHVYRLKDHAA